MSLGQITTSAFVTCDPAATQTVYTTVYTTTAIAANPTTSWMATYTITEVCTGWPWEYKTRAIPPCFAETTIYCEPCAQKTIPIICPIPTPTANVVINGNGVTANANPAVTAAPYGAYGGYGSYSGGGGANNQNGGSQPGGGGSNPGGNGGGANGASSDIQGQAPGYGAYGGYGSYDQSAPGQPGAPGASGAGGQPGQSDVAGAPGAPPVPTLPSHQRSSLPPRRLSRKALVFSAVLQWLPA
ncbi:uncharacterized protein ColSpa_00908 [Colletotrichum spaethianum]|uniref:Uncharacterized protein n=1 Tax=Colletotrichum spaethianum TaxID=700344 RepID=A0AA37L2M3_9PEZI|nr:uncharacterized protein ColSpa_00908 [Colletotrichum spaethianum]GKT40727.1 hypothetical protein ColSpa_00908 [Colletotrichum spaethianum]